MVHEMHLHPVPFAAIKAGAKTIEIRLNDEKRRCLNVGDVIAFTKTDKSERITVEILALHRYSTFRELYESVPLVACGLPDDDIDRCLDTIYQIYTKDKEQKHGVLGIEIRLKS